MKIVLSFLFVAACYYTSLAQTVYTRDGVPAGDESMLIRTCKEAADAALKGRPMVLNGIEMNTREYCQCAMLRLIPTIESADLIEANASGTMLDLLVAGDNFNILMECVSENLRIDSSEVSFSNLLELADKIADQIMSPESAENLRDRIKRHSHKYLLRTCVEGVRQEDPHAIVYSDQMAEDYCQCVLESLYESDKHSLSDVMDAVNPTSEVFEKIVFPCAEMTLSK